MWISTRSLLTECSNDNLNPIGVDIGTLFIVIGYVENAVDGDINDVCIQILVITTTDYYGVFVYRSLILMVVISMTCEYRYCLSLPQTITAFYL